MTKQFSEDQFADELLDIVGDEVARMGDFQLLRRGPSKDLFLTLRALFVDAHQLRYELITSEQLLLTLLGNHQAAGALEACGANLDELRGELGQYIIENTPRIVPPSKAVPRRALSFKHVIETAAKEAEDARLPSSPELSPIDGLTCARVLVAFLDAPSSYAASCLRSQKITREDIVKHLSGGMRKHPWMKHPVFKTAMQSQGASMNDHVKPSDQIRNNPLSAVVVANRSGGKSVMLASMFGTMQEQSRNRYPFHLFVEHAAQRNALYSKYRSLTEQVWLPATQNHDFEDITFTVRVDTPDSQTHPVCEFNYIDYAGGFTGGEASETDPNYLRFREKAKHADAIIGMLDGEHIRTYLSRDSTPAQKKSAFVRMEQDVYRVISFIKTYKTVDRRELAVQLIVSKWDEFEHCGISLDEVIAALHQTDGFTDFVEHLRKKTNALLRLIPISSVGRDATTMVRSDESVRFNLVEGQRLKPHNVEALLSFLLHARIKNLYTKTLQAKSDTESRSTAVTPEFTWFEEISPVVATIAHGLNDWFGRLFRSQDIDRVITSGRAAKEAEARERERRLTEEKERALAAIKKDEDAFSLALEVFIGIQRTLEKDYPADMLDKPRRGLT